MKSNKFRLSRGLGSMTTKIIIVAIASLGGTALVSSSVFATLTATANSSASLSTGTLSMTMIPSGVSGINSGLGVAISGMAPGDVVNRYVNLTQAGTLAGSTPTLQLNASSATALTTNATAGLQIAINSCSVDWSATGTCAGSMVFVLPSTPAATLLSAPQSITLPNVAAGSTAKLQVSISLPSGNESVVNGVLPSGTVQGLTTTLTWNFVENVRGNQITHS